MLCPEDGAGKLSVAVTRAREIAEEFNSRSKFSRISINVLTGRIAPDDVEAVRAINGEVRELLEAMASGVKQLDAKAVRDAASKARSIGSMLSPEAQERIRGAVEAARGAAREIVKAGDSAAAEIDRSVLRKIREARGAFLDIDGAREIGAVKTKGRAVDYEAPGDAGESSLTAVSVPQGVIVLGDAVTGASGALLQGASIVGVGLPKPPRAPRRRSARVEPVEPTEAELQAREVNPDTTLWEAPPPAANVIQAYDAAKAKPKIAKGKEPANL